jgi:hypothetical protein
MGKAQYKHYVRYFYLPISYVTGRRKKVELNQQLHNKLHRASQVVELTDSTRHERRKGGEVIARRMAPDI